MLQIKKIRKSKGISSTELASRLGLEASAIRKWESFASCPRSDKLPAIAAALGCTIADLYDDLDGGNAECCKLHDIICCGQCEKYDDCNSACGWLERKEEKDEHDLSQRRD